MRKSWRYSWKCFKISFWRKIKKSSRCKFKLYPLSKKKKKLL